MKTLKVGNLELSRLGLGGGKFVNLDISEGRALVEKARSLGINVFDAHHRYGNAERVFALYPDVVRMTKVSAYKVDEYQSLVANSIDLLRKIDIMWVSDLDDVTLYDQGEKIYNTIKSRFPRLGITSENPHLAFRFLNHHPECDFFMVPIYKGMDIHMLSFIQQAKVKNKIVFGIKSTLDGLLLKNYSIRECLEYAKKVDPDVLLVGTKNPQHLEEVVKIYEEELK